MKARQKRKCLRCERLVSKESNGILETDFRLCRDCRNSEEAQYQDQQRSWGEIFPRWTGLSKEKVFKK